MSLPLLNLLAVMLLLDPTEVIDAEAAAAVSEDADRVELPSKAATDFGKGVVIESESCDYDRNEGVILFDGKVKIIYGQDYTMCADRIFTFLSSSNELNRVVAIGRVAITNETRVGFCQMATYRRRRSEIEMFGDEHGNRARLMENGEEASELLGSRIRFWLDSERVEVEDSQIKVQQGGEASRQ